MGKRSRSTNTTAAPKREKTDDELADVPAWFVAAVLVVVLLPLIGLFARGCWEWFTLGWRLFGFG